MEREDDVEEGDRGELGLVKGSNPKAVASVYGSRR